MKHQEQRSRHRHRTAPRLRPAGAALLAAVALTVPHAAAATYTFDNPLGGAINVSTNFTPVGVPGPSDTLVIDDLPRIFTNTTLTVPTNQAIAGISYGHYGQTSLNGPGTLTLQNGTIAFDDAITEAPGSPLTSLFINAPITSGGTLKVTGRGFALISGTNTANGLSITGPGGVSVGTDGSLGAAGAGVALSGGGRLRAISSFTTSRSLTLSGSSGWLESYGNLVWNGSVTGFGALVISGSSLGSTTLGGTVGNSEGVFVENGTTLTLTGSIISSSVVLRGAMNLGTSSSGAATNALADSGSVSSDGGTLRMFARSVDTFETTGTLLMANGGTTTFELNPNVNAGARLHFNSGPTRFNRSTLFIRGRDLGGGSIAANRALLTFGTAPAMIGGGGATLTSTSIVPWIVGNANVTGGISQASVVDAGLVTFGPNGLRPLAVAEYAPDFSGIATNNVRITDGVFTQSSNATLNALVVRDTMASTSGSGVTGTGTLNITSGTIAAVSDLTGEELYIDNPINFGVAEGIIHVLPTADGWSTLTINGAISGTNGLTKSANGDLLLTNTASTFTGTTTVLAGRLIFSGDVPASGASALGASAANIRLAPGENRNTLTELLAATPDAVIARSITLGRFDETSGARAVLGTLTGAGATFSGNITLDASLSLRGGTDPSSPLVLAGVVIGGGSGAGGLSDPNVAFPQSQYIRLTSANTYSGGTIIRGGEWQAGSNTAFGTGTIYFAGNNTTTPTGAISAFGGARTIGNPLVFREAPVFSGTDVLTFTGSVDLGSVNQQVYVTNTTSDTTFAGSVGRGGLIKRGDGRLVLSGNNTFNGQTIAYEGALRAASNNALGVAAGSVNPTQGTFIVNTGSLELAGGITTSEAIFMGSGTIPIAAANPLGNLRSVSGSNTINEAIAFDNVGTVGVDAGSTLTLTGDTVDNTTNTTAAIRKVGGGTFVVKNVRLNTLDVQAGTVRVAPGTVPTGTSRISNLSVAAGGLLDLTNNTLIYDYTSTSPRDAVRTLLQQGRIDTSSGGANGAVAYVEASNYLSSFPGNVAGQVVDNTTLLLLYTIAGDADLNKTVGFSDLLTLAKNYNATGRVWTQGDFDYDGSVGFSDLLIVAKAYNQTAATSATLDGAPSAFAADWALAQSLVPEPTMLLASGLIAPLARRRRRR